MNNKPNIIIISRGDKTWLGGRHYFLNLLKALIDHRNGSDCYDLTVVVKNGEEMRHYELLNSDLRSFKNLERLISNFTLINRVRWKLKRTFDNWTYPRLEECILRLNPSFVYPLCSTKIPSADWIPDFQYHYFPELTSAADVTALKKEFNRVAKLSKGVVLSSYSAQYDCQLLFPQSVGRTHVLQFRVFADAEWYTDDPNLVTRKYNLPIPFVLVSNSFIPTKNHKILIDALAAIPPAERRTMRVVCTGDVFDSRNPSYFSTILNLMHERGVSNQFLILGTIPKRDQIQLLRAAIAYVQPSLFEGWNTGVEEAHLFGKKVLLSDIQVHREQAPSFATFFDPHDPGALASKLRECFAAANGFISSIDAESESFAMYASLQKEFAQRFLSIKEHCTK